MCLGSEGEHQYEANVSQSSVKQLVGQQGVPIAVVPIGETFWSLKGSLGWLQGMIKQAGNAS